MHIACIVEGHGEVEALPVLLRRIFSEVDVSINPIIKPPIRVKRQRLFELNEFERVIQLANEKAGDDGVIICVLDADDDCPAEKCYWIRTEAERIVPGATVRAVMAVREFESWFIAAAESISGCRGLQPALVAPYYSEDIRGCKEWLSRNMSRERHYRPTVDQAALAAQFDLGIARLRSRSFSKLYRDIESLVQPRRAQ